jgi:hypothetical protein
MNNELLILDLDDTLANESGLFPGVSEFLTRQNSRRECIIATMAAPSVERDIANVRKSVQGFYHREIVARGYDFMIHKGTGKLVHKNDVPKGRAAKDYYIYKNPYGKDGYALKDLHLTRLYHSQKCHPGEQNAVFIGDLAELENLSKSPYIP